MSEAELVEMLGGVGVKVRSVWDLVNRKSSYPKAVPILAEWLERKGSASRSLEDRRTWEGVVRSLAVKEARGSNVPELLLNEFARDDLNDLERWAVGNTLEAVIGPSDFDRAVSLVLDDSYGIGRQMLVMALPRTKNVEAVTVLIKLLKDDDVVSHAISALRTMKAVDAIQEIESLLDHERATVRRQARSAVERLSSLQKKEA